MTVESAAGAVGAGGGGGVISHVGLLRRPDPHVPQASAGLDPFVTAQQEQQHLEGGSAEM